MILIEFWAVYYTSCNMIWLKNVTLYCVQFMPWTKMLSASRCQTCMFLEECYRKYALAMFISCYCQNAFACRQDMMQNLPLSMSLNLWLPKRSGTLFLCCLGAWKFPGWHRKKVTLPGSPVLFSLARIFQNKTNVLNFIGIFMNFTW